MAEPRRWRQALGKAEVDALLEIDDRRAWLSVAINWGLVAIAFAIVAAWPNPLTVVAALLVIGCRQLGCAVLMHEAAHRTLFRERRTNDWVGNWLCAYPVWADLHPYRPYHLQHHAKNWTKDDPDLDLATKHPVSAASMRRKIWRDLSGQVAWKRVRALVTRELGRSTGKMASAKGAPSEFFARQGLSRATRGMLISNGILIGIVTLAGYPALYLLWVGAWFTTYSFITRLRSIAEHSMIDDPADELKNTRTTVARWWERLILAPNYVNYHLEHHLLMTVPHYNLPKMHRLLRERGQLEDALVTRGYARVLRQAASGSPSAAA